MPKYIVKLSDKYLEYSTICDAPVTFGMSRDEMRAYLIERYGTAEEAETDRRLDRCDAIGTSSMMDTSAEDALSYNRAGPCEVTLTVDEIKTAYCDRLPIRDGWTPR